MSITIDCRTCSLKNSAHCGDCVVSYILSRPLDESPGDAPVEDTAPSTVGSTADSTADSAVVIDAGEYFAVRRLQAAGLVPELLHDRMGG